MASKIESGLGAKLKRAQDLLVLVSQFQNFNPPRSEDQIASFSSLLDELLIANNTIAQLEEQTAISISQRQDAYRNNEFSVLKSLTLIAKAVEAQFGKKAKETELVLKIVRQMRPSSKKKATSTPISDGATDVKIIPVPKSISELSFGTIIQRFRNLIETLGQLPGYDPSNPELKVASLSAKADQLLVLNNDVTLKMQNLKAARFSRTEKYLQMTDSAKRIKAYVLAEYGKNSQENNVVKGLKF
jgi:hypothetical protein